MTIKELHLKYLKDRKPISYNKQRKLNGWKAAFK